MLNAKSKCKICRRNGEKLFLKGERCFTPKCAMVRKPYSPGIHGNKRMRRRRKSDYGVQLTEKQKARFIYGISEHQFRRYIEESLNKKSSDAVHSFVAKLESRLDNVIFRSGLSVSRSMSKQLISHGHVTVNGDSVNIPSYMCKLGDTVRIKDKSIDSGMFRNIDILLKKFNPPDWIDLNKKDKSARIKSRPTVDEFIGTHNVKSIIEYYSR